MSSALAILTLLVAPMVVGTASVPRLPAGVRWAMGAVILCLAGLLLHGAGVSRAPARWFLGAAVLAGAVKCVVTPGSIRRSRVDPLLGLTFGLVAAAGTLLVLSHPVNAWDAVTIWYAKTRALLAWRPPSAMPVPAYPELGPMGWSLVLAIASPFAEPCGRLWFLGLYLAWLTSLSLWLPARPSLQSRVVLILAVLAQADLGSITNGYQDAVVMSVAGLSAALLGSELLVADEEKACPRGGRSHVASGLFLAGILGTIKAEGAVLGAILVGGWLITVAIVRGRRALVTSLPYVGVWLAASLVWPLLLVANGVRPSAFQSGAYGMVSADEVLARLSRIPFILYGFLRMGPWYALPIVAAALAAGAAWRAVATVRPVIAWLWGCAVAHSLWIVTVFLVTNLDFHWHVRTALDRLAFQHSFVWPMVTIVSVGAVLRHRSSSLSETGRR